MSEIDMKRKFPSMKPVKSPPPLFRLNGCGVGMYGSRDHDAETGTYISTLCLSLVFIPVLCLRAYRVAKAQRGWYFIGREPLSTLAKVCNLCVVLAIACIIGVSQYHSYTSSPAYIANRQMTKARQMVDQGQLAQAAKIYQQLAIAGADEAQHAAVALGELLNKPCSQAKLSECAGVYAAAAKITHLNGAVPPADVVQKGLYLVDDKADSDPRSGSAVLDAIRPLMVDTRPIDTRRLSLLRKWAAAEPNNLDVLCPLASLLEQQNKLDEAKKLLMPVKDRLAGGEGACVLGTILARQGDYDGAYAMLWPYVQEHLDKLHAAERTCDSTSKNLWDQQIKLLNENKAPQDFYNKYRNASKDQQQTMVQEYIQSRIKVAPEYAAAQDTLHREAAVVPITLELGIVMLQRAQAQSNPDLRKTQLQAAEKVFLAIGGFAGQSDEYRLSLGQVCYWLGKPDEGRKLFDAFLATKGRDSDSLLAIAGRLRLLGAVPEARTTAEEAYTKATKDEQRHEAAGLRALCSKDNDDEIVWLNKGDTASPTTKARLANARGTKAIAEGRDSEASTQFHIAIDAYNAMPRSAMTLNETACAWYAIFEITGDHQALDRCFDNFQQAVDLSPGDAILINNAADTLLAAALDDVIGTEIDLRALHATGRFSLLGYLYQDKDSRDAVAKRVKDHPGIARALSYYEKLMVISPKSTHAYATAFEIHQFTRNDAAMKVLDQRIKGTVFDTSDELSQTKDFLNGVRDEQNKVQFAATLKRAEDATVKLRDKGGRTLAVALGQQAEAMLIQDMVKGDVDAQKVVALAEEACRICPSTRSSAILSAAYLFRADKDLCRSDPAFASFHRKYSRSLGSSYLLAAGACEPGPFQQKILQNADVHSAMSLMREQDRLFPEDPSLYRWALLKNADPVEAGKLADAIQNNRRQLVEQSISSCLHPASIIEAMEVSWFMQISGKPAEARAALRKVAAFGIPVPEQPQ